VVDGDDPTGDAAALPGRNGGLWCAAQRGLLEIDA